MNNNNFIPATEKNIIRGVFSSKREPIAYVKSGNILEIETINPAGIIEGFSEFVEKKSINKNDELIKKMILADSLIKPENNDHILTGPIYIEEALPGDTLEIRILETKLLGEFGNIDLLPGRGGIPDLVKYPISFMVSFDEKKFNGKMGRNIFRLDPFFGVIAVATPDNPLSIKPGNFGGNLDLKEIKAGASVFLPVMVPGGLFYVGDGHAIQGDGEVGLSAVECCLEGKFQFILHKEKTLTTPRVENENNLIAIGLGESLDIASYNAIKQAVEWIMEKNDGTFEEALAIASISVDFRITQVVNGIKGVHAMIPKHLFKNIKK